MSNGAGTATTVEKVEKPALALPLEPSVPTRDWLRQKFVMLGQAGIGKSEYWAQDAAPFFVDAEGNLNHLAVRKLPCRSWDDLRDIYVLLYQAYQAGKFPYSSIVIDTLDRLYTYAQEEVVMRAKEKFRKVADSINTIADVPEGVGWFMLQQLVLNFLIKLEDFPCAKVVICHVSNKEIKEPTRSIHKDTINIGGQLGTAILAWSNHILHVRARLLGHDLQRIVWTLPNETIEAKSQGAIVPTGMTWSTDAKSNFDALRKLFT